MEVLTQSEAFEEKDGDWVFSHTKVILRKGSQHYYALTVERQAANFDPAQLECVRIPDEHIYPAASPTFLRAPDPLPPNVYIKTPDLVTYGSTPESSNVAAQTLQEIQICEILRQHPHPNIAQYLGCLVTDNKIHGICFAKYKITLAEYLRNGYNLNVEQCLAGIERAVSHLHDLKLVHNDLNPFNIMLDDNNEPILIDFDSCMYEGEELGLKGGTEGWAEHDIRTASFANDIYGLAKIREHLAAYDHHSLTRARPTKNVSE
ncbi:kinase-like protein [Nemania sp. FL0916]|nr:kinase-like protein [Nemania sp. FL0916]